MGSLKKTYQNAMTFVDSFINSTTPTFNKPEELPKDADAWYATWEDNYIGDFLNNSITKAALRKIADTYYSQQLEGIIQKSTELSVLTHPTLYSIYKECCRKLGFVRFPKLYVTGQIQGINALSVEVKGRRLILLSRMSTIRLNEQELKFILGHELGHHQQGNLACHTVNGLLDTLNNSSEIFGPMISDTIEVPMKRWCRQSEFNADRAGLICCEDLEVIINLFLKLGMQPSQSAYNEYKELEASHPHLNTRLAALTQYANSQKTVIS
ncbi:MAG: M48 family metallopeptidase [Bacteroidaceae bacterium]|nr:M48 family metallopeptidase [Bacteroidaceae bacterium]